MSTDMPSDLSILVPAAGQGDRLGLGPKALLRINGRSLLSWLAAKALRCSDEVIVAAPPGRCGEWEAECPGCRVVPGAGTHLASLARLVREAGRPWVLNVNVSMPFVSEHMIREVAAAARSTGAAGAFLEPDIPVAELEAGVLRGFRPRQGIGLAQGPNAYDRALLLSILDKADEQDWSQQSLLQVVTRHGVRVTAVKGERRHIKITDETDWALACQLGAFL
jgi:2-C-methyl-D-erythritol 4-phosphate cytidylyltransferase